MTAAAKRHVIAAPPCDRLDLFLETANRLGRAYALTAELPLDRFWRRMDPWLTVWPRQLAVGLFVANRRV